MKSPVGSETSTIEDIVRAETRGPILVGGREVIAAGSEVVGTVTEAVRAGRVKGRARVSFQFTSLQHDAQRYEVSTAAISAVADATKGEDATKIAIGAGAGAAIGAVLGGKDGAAKGAAIGGAGGTGVVLATRGSEVRLEPGTTLATRLTAPLTIRLRVAK